MEPYDADWMDMHRKNF